MLMTATATQPEVGDSTESAYSVRQVANLLGVPQRRLRYWSQTGFISPSVRNGGRLFYSFRDLIAVKVAKALLDGGVPLRRVRRSLKALSRRLPDEGVSLAALRVRSQGDQVVVEHAEGSFEAATGQLVLDFDTARLRDEAAAVLELPWVTTENTEPTTAYAWFQHGCDLEDEWSGSPVDLEGFEAAKHAYEQALSLDPELAAAWTNLGSMLAELGRDEEARHHFEQALRCDPDQPEAHCNVAELALRTGDLDNAIARYRQVLQLSPEWAEAHYGLARALLEVGGKAQALAHLQRFCGAVEREAGEPSPEVAARRDSALDVIAKLERELGRDP